MRLKEVNNKREAMYIISSKMLENETLVDGSGAFPFLKGFNHSLGEIIDGSEISYKINLNIIGEILGDFQTEGMVMNFGLANNSYSYLVRDINKLRQKIDDLHHLEVLHGTSGNKKKSINNNGNDKQLPDNLIIRLSKSKLEINKKTGIVKLNDVSYEMNPIGDEFKTIIMLATNNNYMATYEELLDNNISKSKKRNLTFVIRNIKRMLGILPEKKARNKDIIKNLKNHGYRLRA